jgi:type IV pilus assembly protein PilA
MKPEVTLKYLSYLRNKKQNGEEGFTLIELLVVVIIIGVLAAVALPNLLGQVGKARETEGKNGVGTVNRAQQSYHFEKATFSRTLTNSELQTQNVLGVIVPDSKYYSFTVTAAASTALATISAQGVIPSGTQVDNGAAQGTRDFVGGTDFDGAGSYGQIICQADVTGDSNATTVTTGVITTGSVAGTGCTTGDTEIK